MATLIGAAILVFAAAIVIPDVLRSLRTTKPADNPNVGGSLIPGSVNDPAVLALQARLDSLAIAIGSGVGGIAGGGAGAAVSSAEVQAARGLGTSTISESEIDSIVARTAAAASAAGAATGVNAGTVAGEGVGSGVASFILGTGSGAGRAAAVKGLGTPTFDWVKDLLAPGGLADRLGLPKIGG